MTAAAVRQRTGSENHRFCNRYHARPHLPRTAIAVPEGALYGVSRDDFDVEYLVGLNLAIPELAG